MPVFRYFCIACLIGICSVAPCLFAQKDCGCLKPNDASISQEKKNADFVLAMLEDFAEDPDTQKLDKYFSPDFVLFLNGYQLRYNGFQNQVQAISSDFHSIHLKKPFSDLFGKGDRVVARFRFSAESSNNGIKESEVIGIFQIKDQKIYRWWVLTHPGF